MYDFIIIYIVLNVCGYDFDVIDDLMIHFLCD